MLEVESSFEILVVIELQVVLMERGSLRVIDIALEGMHQRVQLEAKAE